MRIGIALPNTIPGVHGRLLVEWAKAAEAAGFSTLSTVGRIVFPTHDELIALTAAAAVTSRIELFTNVLIGPLYDPVVLARQAASLDQISGGRFTMGLAVGWRPTDFTVVGRDWHTRGKRLDADIETMLQVWAGEKVLGADKVMSPPPTNGSVPLAFGGSVPASYERIAKRGVGYTAAGATPEQMDAYIANTNAAWTAAGRTGTPRFWSLGYYGLSAEAEAVGAAYLTDYYGDWGGGMAAGMPKTPEAILATVEAFKATGTDEFIFVPTKGDIAELDALVAALGGKTTF